MAKATQDLSATRSLLNRRTVLSGGVAALAAPAAVAQASSPLATQPTDLGRALLATVPELRRLIEARAPLCDREEAAEVRLLDAQADAVRDQIQGIERAILARPITELAHVVDRALVAAYHGGRNIDGTWSLNGNPLDAVAFIEAVCGLGGVSALDAVV